MLFAHFPPDDPRLSPKDRGLDWHRYAMLDDANPIYDEPDAAASKPRGPGGEPSWVGSLAGWVLDVRKPSSAERSLGRPTGYDAIARGEVKRGQRLVCFSRNSARFFWRTLRDAQEFPRSEPIIRRTADAVMYMFRPAWKLPTLAYGHADVRRRLIELPLAEIAGLDMHDYNVFELLRDYALSGSQFA